MIRKRTIAGNTLVEAMIALLVLSVGLLVLLGMLARGIHTLAESTWQSRAIRMAGNLAELLALLPRDVVAAQPAPAAIECDVDRACTPHELLADYTHQWQRQIANGLPGGRGSYDLYTGAGTESARIELTWHDQWGRPVRYRTLAALNPLLSP
jgi:type IV pilus assembly protein PilV